MALDRSRFRFLTAALLVLALFAAVSTGRAQTGGGYNLEWNTIDGGGGTSTGGGYSLSGTVGQADAGTLAQTPYTLLGGFWSGVAVEILGARLYLPAILK
jgi:hypothetical protein